MAYYTQLADTESPEEQRIKNILSDIPFIGQNAVGFLNDFKTVVKDSAAEGAKPWVLSAMALSGIAIIIALLK